MAFATNLASPLLVASWGAPGAFRPEKCRPASGHPEDYQPVPAPVLAHQWSIQSIRTGPRFDTENLVTYKPRLSHESPAAVPHVLHLLSPSPSYPSTSSPGV